MNDKYITENNGVTTDSRYIESKMDEHNKRKIKKIILIVAIIVASIFLLGTIWSVSVNNSAIKSEEQILESKSAIDIQVNKRNETIITLIQVVEKYDEHEQAIIDAVAEARADLKSGDVSGATTEINAILEAYPEIKSAENYNTLMLEISQCENQIARYQENYNLQVKDYKKFIRTFPNRMFLDMGGYEAIDVAYLDLAGQNNLDITNLFG